MRRDRQSTSRIVIALTTLSLLWLLSGYVPSAPAFAEGSGQPLPIENLPVDTTTATNNPVGPEGGMTTADVVGAVILYFTAVL